MTKKIYVAISHLQKAPITAGSENVPGSRCSTHGRKYYHFCQIKRFKCSYTKLYTRKEFTRFELSKPLLEWWTAVTFGHLS